MNTIVAVNIFEFLNIDTVWFAGKPAEAPTKGEDDGPIDISRIDLRIGKIVAGILCLFNSKPSRKKLVKHICL